MCVKCAVFVCVCACVYIYLLRREDRIRWRAERCLRARRAVHMQPASQPGPFAFLAFHHSPKRISLCVQRTEQQYWCCWWLYTSYNHAAVLNLLYHRLSACCCWLLAAASRPTAGCWRWFLLRIFCIFCFLFVTLLVVLSKQICVVIT